MWQLVGEVDWGWDGAGGKGKLPLIGRYSIRRAILRLLGKWVLTLAHVWDWREQWRNIRDSCFQLGTLRGCVLSLDVSVHSSFVGTGRGVGGDGVQVCIVLKRMNNRGGGLFQGSRYRVTCRRQQRSPVFSATTRRIGESPLCFL